MFTLEKNEKKKSRGYGPQISETGVSVNHTFNVFGKFSMCRLFQHTFMSEFYTVYVILYVIILD